MTRSIPLLAAATLMAMMASVPAQAAGDAAGGEAVAKDNCVRCHNISPGGQFKEFPPSFAAIAVYYSDDQIFEHIFFPPLHSTMFESVSPLYTLSRDQVWDLVAYIRSLEKKNVALSN
jgi:mono/diheme cytochrome c family protein